MKPVLFIFCINLLFSIKQCARILGVFPAPGYSQFILAEVLMKEIANRGHEVTVISPYKPHNAPPNYKTIETSDVIENSDGINLYELDNESLFKNILTTYQYGNIITEVTLKDKGVQQLLHSDENFDLVIVEQFFNDAMKGFATQFNAPLVLFSSMGLTEWNKGYMGNPTLPSINAVSYTSYTNQMNFFQRIRNLVGTIFDYCYRKWVFYPIQKEYLEKYFPASINFDKIISNASLMLLNSHFTTSENVLLPYNMIEIGGFHITQNPLNKDIQKMLDEATDGAILFSLGSNLKSSDLTPITLNIILTVLGRLKQKVLWKFEKDLPERPKNVFISKWLKQADILAHPNIQLFITHGGMLSTTEAIFNGVPMLGIPVFADQKMNTARAKNAGIANTISLKDLTEEKFFSLINETINDSKYSENARRMSTLMRDRVVRPLDLALYWIEYAIRHGGVRFETPVLKMYWYQVYMVDILCFLICTLFIMYMLVKLLCTFIQKEKCKTNSKISHTKKYK
ncbi:UDP-glucosyltransferase 2-like [Tribolium madens]|uniref:UDP-glucosyltransferase 2-like n=1 Tax=Tribolium madens TaxID=41895 RepID=UPI001CF71D9D|nr:UDP-glucosyltransferase 2-like [Tribolium madens]